MSNSGPSGRVPLMKRRGQANRFNDRLPKVGAVGHQGFVFRGRESGLTPQKGFIHIRMEDAGHVQEFAFQNVIVQTASILVARLMKDNLEVGLKGATYLAIGQGAPAWDLQNPPTATASQTQMENEVARKVYSQVDFIDSLGNVSVAPTNIVDFTTIFAEGEAVAPWVEMGLVGGEASATPYTGTLINYHTFPVINKPATATMTVVWRLTF